jgi:two-component system OmpR family response regulator
VLVIEDSAPTRELLVRSLSDLGMSVATAARFTTGLREAITAHFECIVLDLMLPDGDGLELCRKVRDAGVHTPILCLTARGDVSDRVSGLDAGADDYLRKPFALAELHARIRALARRRGPSPPRRLAAGIVSIDFTARLLQRGGHEVPLTPREWSVLEILVARTGRVVARNELLESAWQDTSHAASESLDVILSRLRRKLGKRQDGCSIRTVRGEGFVFEVDA